MSEFITIQVGQCGNQIGNALWPLILDEYGISQVPDGIHRDKYNDKSDFTINDGFHSFFHVPENAKVRGFKTFSDLKQAKVKARAILIDMEEGIVNKYRTGPMRGIFSNQNIITNYPGSGNNWAEGFYEHGQKYENDILTAVQSSLEKCDSLHGFLLLFSLGGGTGSGLGTATLKLLADNYPLIDRFVCAVYPSGTEDVIIAPYNVALSTSKLIQYASCVFPVENRQLIDILNLLQNYRSKETLRYMANCKPFQDMNSIIVNMLLHLTSGSRFPGALNLDMSDLVTNMVPYPRLHYLSTSYFPHTLAAMKSSASSNRQFLENMYNGITSHRNQLVKLTPLDKQLKLIGATIQGRGAITITDLRYVVRKLQLKGQFTPWSKTAIKLGLCSIPPTGHDYSLFGIFNTTAMQTLYENVLTQFTKLYKRKAHVHHYCKIDGFEHEQFKHCPEIIESCIEDYKSIATMTPRNSILSTSRYEIL
ncbi:tubulin epsilon chain-like [Chrysoperla carnea]|uniref:tubulin epsilon chain-like n=1 Tax=Chrysoperla carnea TaxID=189513 RepID=UPI001D067865|nr:tubulin epsilon chain-like [Chrysoperla carnea]